MVKNRGFPDRKQKSNMIFRYFRKFYFNHAIYTKANQTRQYLDFELKRLELDINEYSLSIR